MEAVHVVAWLDVEGTEERLSLSRGAFPGGLLLPEGILEE